MEIKQFVKDAETAGVCKILVAMAETYIEDNNDPEITLEEFIETEFQSFVDSFEPDDFGIDSKQYEKVIKWVFDHKSDVGEITLEQFVEAAC